MRVYVIGLWFLSALEYKTVSAFYFYQPDMDAGDVLVILQQTEHTEFVRQGIDLIAKKKITLAEALCGFNMTITHLDDRRLLIKNKPGQVVSPGKIFVRCVHNHMYCVTPTRQYACHQRRRNAYIS